MRDKPALAAAAAFAEEVLKAAAIPPLVGLVQSHELRHRSQGVRAVRELALHGSEQVKNGWMSQAHSNERAHGFQYHL
jgi:hypothetical protein